MIEFKSYFSSSAGNLHTCSDGHTEIIIDFGVSFKQAQKALNYRISDACGCIITHRHR